MSIPTFNRNITWLGDGHSKKQAIHGIGAAQVADKPGILVLQAATDAANTVNYYYWTDSNGILRVHTSVPTNQDSDGSAVGAAASVTLDAAYDNGATINGAIAVGSAIKLGGAGASDNVSIYHDATDLYFVVNTGDLKITAAGGDVNFDNENLTSTGWLKIGSTVLTIGTTNTTPYVYNNAGALTFFDTDYNSAITLKTLAGGALNNPTVTGSLTITDGALVWSKTANTTGGTFTFSGTSATALQITTGITTGTGIDLIANAATTGSILKIQATEGTLTSGSGFYINCYDNTGPASVFTVTEDGITTIAGPASGTAALTLTSGDLVITAGQIRATNVADVVPYDFARNHATSTSAVLHIHQDHTGSTGACLDLVQDGTGAAPSVAIATAGTGSAVNITNSVVTGTGLTITGPASQTASQLIVDGSTGAAAWVGASTTGMVHLTSDGALVADASLLRIASSGNIASANDGACLEVIESGAAQATSYAVRIASTSNEALHVDTGVSLFDERVTITLADNTGPALAITNPDTTGNSNAVTITPSGSGAGLLISPQEADTMAISVVGVASSTVSAVKVDGSAGAGFLGAANVGMVHLVNDGTYADVAATELYIGNSGVPQNDSRGHCLRIVDTGNAAAGTMAYPVYISSNDATVGGVYITTSATGEALTVAAGTASFAGAVTLTAGVKNMVVTTDVTAGAPTDAEIDGGTLGTAASRGAGFTAIIDDANGHAALAIVVSDGTTWHYAALTKCS